MTTIQARPPTFRNEPITTWYEYRDENGRLKYIVGRTANKDFPVFHPNGSKWRPGYGGQRILYGLAELLAADMTEPVLLVEGEKDTDRALAEGLIATTTPGGAGAAEHCDLGPLIGRTVAIIPDSDEPGRTYAADLTQLLTGKVAAIKIIELAGLPDKGDISDWFEVGHTAEELRQLIEDQAPETTRVSSGPNLGGSSISQGRSDSLSLDTSDAEGAEVPTFPRTDAGNAELLAYLYGDLLKHDHSLSRWLKWEDPRWRQDRLGDVFQLSIKASRWRYARAVSLSDLKERNAEAAFAIGSENRARIEAALVLAKSGPDLRDPGDDWDANPYLLGTENGTVDLTDGSLRPGRREDRITMGARLTYDANAACPRWEQFLAEIFDDDLELIDFVWRAVGYSLTGLTSEQVLFFCWGRGANGKSVFLTILRLLLGDYADNGPFTLFELNNRPAIPNDLAALKGKRLVTASETNDGTRLNEARIKALTGGDPITARFLYGEAFTFNPVSKIWLALNHKPRVHDDSLGFWRRVRLIPFTRQFQGDKDDKGLVEKLRSELPGILAWAVRGCLEWQQRGLEPPASILEATDDYRAESDRLADFLSQRCVLGHEFSSLAGPLFKDYLRWGNEQGLRERDLLTNTAFGRSMGDRFNKRPTREGRLYKGVGLRNARQTELNVTGFTSDDPSHSLKSSIDSSTRELLENPSQPFTPVTEGIETCSEPDCELLGTYSSPTDTSLVCYLHFENLVAKLGAGEKSTAEGL